ncbi:hypothetical protein DB31_5770 [Hyalangium minutum]|uniref:Uncharacterized protein n=1 Tax=Hyalangium minutum TaxID=394096 RepID=A0A085WSR5_9BACT|nr:hypothetical protein DB31_5770 [Hyalangium minutum]
MRRELDEPFGAHTHSVGGLTRREGSGLGAESQTHSANDGLDVERGRDLDSGGAVDRRGGLGRELGGRAGGEEKHQAATERGGEPGIQRAPRRGGATAR